MKRKTKLRTIPKNTTVAEVVERMRQEEALIKEQYRELKQLQKTINHSTEWVHSDDLEWEYLINNIDSYIEDVEKFIDYLETQLAVLEKAEVVFESDDPKAIKELAKDYLVSDISVSLKNCALHRYDNAEAIKLLADYKAS